MSHNQSKQKVIKQYSPDHIQLSILTCFFKELKKISNRDHVKIYGISEINDYTIFGLKKKDKESVLFNIKIVYELYLTEKCIIKK